VYSLAHWFWFRFSHKGAAKMSVWDTFIWRLGWKINCQGDSLTRGLVSASCWQEASVPLHMGLSQGYLSVLMTWSLASSRAGDPRTQFLLWPSLRRNSSVIPHYPVRSSLFSVERDPSRMQVPGGEKHGHLKESLNTYWENKCSKIFYLE
jgi:hypothetical protein